MLVTSSLNTIFLKYAWRNVAEKQGSENSKYICTNLLSVIQSFSSLCLIVKFLSLSLCDLQLHSKLVPVSLHNDAPVCKF